MHALTCMFSWSRSQAESLGHAPRQGLAGRLSGRLSHCYAHGQVSQGMFTGRLTGRLSRGQAHRQVLRRICSHRQGQRQAFTQARSGDDAHEQRQIWTGGTARQPPSIPVVGLLKCRGRRRIGIDVIGLAGPARVGKIPLPAMRRRPRRRPTLTQTCS